MLSPDLIDKYNNQLIKAATYDTAELAELFDYYQTHYTAYNMFFNEVPAELSRAGLAMPSRLVENQLATKFVLMYIGSQQLIGAFINSGNQPDINDITAIMAQDLFNIKLHNGVPDKKYDHDLLNDLQSGQSQQICLAILKVIYQVRCNLVHGSKNYQEYQRILLEPLSRLLITLQQQLFQKLT